MVSRIVPGAAFGWSSIASVLASDIGRVASTLESIPRRVRNPKSSSTSVPLPGSKRWIEGPHARGREEPTLTYVSFVKNPRAAVGAGVVSARNGRRIPILIRLQRPRRGEDAARSVGQRPHASQWKRGGVVGGSVSSARRSAIARSWVPRGGEGVQGHRGTPALVTGSGARSGSFPSSATPSLRAGRAGRRVGRRRPRSADFETACSLRMSRPGPALAQSRRYGPISAKPDWEDPRAPRAKASDAREPRVTDPGSGRPDLVTRSFIRTCARRIGSKEQGKCA